MSSCGVRLFFALSTRCSSALDLRSRTELHLRLRAKKCLYWHPHLEIFLMHSDNLPKDIVLIRNSRNKGVYHSFRKLPRLIRKNISFAKAYFLVSTLITKYLFDLLVVRISFTDQIRKSLDDVVPYVVANQGLSNLIKKWKQGNI